MSVASAIERCKGRARRLRVETHALLLAYKDPRVPWYAKIFVACVVGYAFSPVDLIPDFIPIVGYLDDLLLVPLGIALALRMIPKPVMEECREKAVESLSQSKPTNWLAGAAVIALWLLLIACIALAVTRAIRG